MLDFLQPLIGLLQGYPFVFIFFGMLIAGEAVLLPAIFLAATGHLDLAAVISLAVLATALSDLAWYGLGRRFPAATLERIPGRRSNQIVSGLDRMFSRKGAQILFLSKFVYGTRTIAQVLAGVHDMAFRTYIVFNLLGILALSGVLVAIAYSVVGSTRQMGDLVEHRAVVFLLFVIVAVSANYLATRMLRKKWSR